MGLVEDLLTVASLILDRESDPQTYVALRIASAQDPCVRRKWSRVRDAIEAMLSERHAGGGAARAAREP